ncbi:MAG: flexitail domain-containing putative surface protein [Dehalococcoidia bacterium]
MPEQSRAVRSRRGRSQSRYLLAVRVALLALVGGAALWVTSTESVAPTAGAQPFFPNDAIVVVSEREVCSLLGDQKVAAGIRGQDHGDMVELNGTVYWAFGDTLIANGGMIPNLLGSTNDLNAGDCIDLTPTLRDGVPVPLLPVAPGELTVWAIALAVTQPDRMHFYYVSINQTSGLRGQGTGIGSFDLATMTGRREVGGALVWPPDGPQPARTFQDGGYVYIQLTDTRQTWTTETLLGRVPESAITSPSQYQYWWPDPSGEGGTWRSDLWDAATGSWKPEFNDLPPLWSQVGAHNGVDVAYNPFLGRWLGVYTNIMFGQVGVRSAGTITGPWSNETMLIDCAKHHDKLAPGFLCYSGAQHEMYAADGGRTIYVTYSNTSDYQVHLFEVRLAAPVVQTVDDQGVASYETAPGGAGAAGTSGGAVAFYASDMAAPGLSAIHGWQDQTTGEVRYGVVAPSGEYADRGVAFYAAADEAAAAATNQPYAPVYRWTNGSQTRYSPLLLAAAGYEQQEIAFYVPCPGSDLDTPRDCEESSLSTDPSAGDRDGDGCSNAAELGPNPELGGMRNPLDPWDFYDTDGGGAVDLFSDILGVANLYGADVGDDGPTEPDGYDPKFDRSPPAAGAEQWQMGAPDGGIDLLTDIFGVMLQFGHTCN